MKIKSVKTFLADGGFRPWTFVRVETDNGLVGWGDCTDWGGARPVAAMIEALEPYVVGEDPLNTDYIWEKLASRNMRHLSGVAHKAMAGIDIACWDIRGKYWNAPVWQLLGGKFRDTIPLYWTHFGWSRVRFPEVVGKSQLADRDGLLAMCEEARKFGFAGVKTNTEVLKALGYEVPSIDPVFPYKNEGMLLRGYRELYQTIRQGLGPDIGIALDVTFSYKLGAAKKLASVIADYGPMWLECETTNPDALKEVRNASSTPVCIGESLFGAGQYKPFFERYAMDIVMPDVAWNGITETRRIIQLARQYDIMFAPHNCHSPLTTFVCTHLCANTPNFYLMEFDYDDVPWRDEMLTYPIEFQNGQIVVPDRPGFGVDVNEEALKKHPPKEYTTK